MVWIFQNWEWFFTSWLPSFVFLTISCFVANIFQCHCNQIVFLIFENFFCFINWIYNFFSKSFKHFLGRQPSCSYGHSNPWKWASFPRKENFPSLHLLCFRRDWCDKCHRCRIFEPLHKIFSLHMCVSDPSPLHTKIFIHVCICCKYTSLEVHLQFAPSPSTILDSPNKFLQV